MSFIFDNNIWLFQLIISLTVTFASIPYDNFTEKINIYDENTDTFEYQIQKSLEVTKNIFATNEFKQAIEIVGVIPYVSEISGALTLLSSTLSVQSEWQTNFAKTFIDVTEKTVANDAIVTLKASLDNIQNKFVLLNTTKADKDGLAGRAQYIKIIENSFGEIIGRFADRKNIFRKHTLLVVPHMLATAKLVAIWSIYAKDYDEHSFNNTVIFCQLKRVLNEYRSLAVFQRVKRLNQFGKSSTKLNLEGFMYEYWRGGSSDRFYQSQPKLVKPNGVVECEIGCAASKLETDDDYCIEDPLDKRELFAGRHDSVDKCIASYAEFLKFRVEEPFNNAITSMNRYCTKQPRNKTEIPTGIDVFVIDSHQIVRFNKFKIISTDRGRLKIIISGAVATSAPNLDFCDTFFTGNVHFLQIVRALMKSK